MGILYEKRISVVWLGSKEVKDMAGIPQWEPIYVIQPWFVVDERKSSGEYVMLDNGRFAYNNPKHWIRLQFPIREQKTIKEAELFFHKAIHGGMSFRGYDSPVGRAIRRAEERNW